MTVTDTSSLQAELERCRQEHARWVEAIRHWQEEHHRAYDTLARVRGFVSKHEALLQELLLSIDSHVRELDRVLDSLGGQHEAPRPEIEESLRRLQADHHEVEEGYKRFASLHRDVMGEMDRLAELAESIRFGVAD
jgi:chromosome segregation ATPase